MQFKNLSILVIVVFLFLSCSLFKKGQSAIAAPPVPVKDSVKKATVDSLKLATLKPYKEVITANALTRRGMFTVHKINDRYFFEIPNQILDKDIMVITRLAQGAASGVGFAGDQVGESQIEFSRGPGNKLFIRVLFYNRGVSTDSSANGMYRALQASNLQPIQAAFDIKAIRPDSSAVVVDVTDFLNSDNPLLYFDAETKKALGGMAYQKDKSYIDNILAFPLNVEIKAVNTYLKGDLPVSLALNVSFVLLPEQAMQPRYFDKRVGYFKQQFLDYDTPDGVKLRDMITRWRLEPKDEDKERYLRGELVEPKKPIVYYIDPATPKKWIPYLIQGVNDWQKAFEKAGFKHAIYALEAPTNDSSFSLLDARHSAIIYKASDIKNASGPQIHDPRSGEILETHINWYHNIQELLHDWYMVQAGPNDAGARKMVFDDSLMGQLIRFVCCHEVGHTLGLRHNMGASATVPTDSLRSKTYLDKNGFCPSIMDYARFNYVAQPEDHLTRSELMPRIGVYDEWAIEYGYRWLPQLKTREQEEAYMNQWIINSQKKDKRLWWGEFEPSLFSIVDDPRRQSEDLGDDAMKASYYGIENLKRVMSQLTNWAVEPNRDYTSLNQMYYQVLAQYYRYAMHVANNIGNKYWTEKSAGQAGPVVQFIPKDVQKKAVEWLAREVFDTPDWLYNKDMFSLVGGLGAYASFPTQNKVIDWLVSFSNYSTMTFAEGQQPKDIYTFDQCLYDLEAEIWKELDKGKSISWARRNLQKAYVERLLDRALPSEIGKEGFMYDFYPLLQKHMQGLVDKINIALPGLKDEDSRWHLAEVKKRLLQGIYFTRYPQGSVSSSTKKSAPTAFSNSWNEKVDSFPKPQTSLKCSHLPVKENFSSPCWYLITPNFLNKK